MWNAAVAQPQGYQAVARQPIASGEVDKHGWDLLMAAAQRGDASAYRRLLSEVAVWLRAYHRRRLPSAMIDDAIQETLIAVHVKRHTYDPGRPFRVWLAAIARYKWIDMIRSLHANSTELLDKDIAEPDHEEATMSALSLERLLAALKPAQSQVIRLVKLQGFSIEEAAKVTGQSATLVKVNIHRGLKRLTSLLQDRSDAD